MQRNTICKLIHQQIVNKGKRLFWESRSRFWVGSVWDRDRRRLEGSEGWGGRVSQALTWLLQSLTLDLLLQLLAFLLCPKQPRMTSFVVGMAHLGGETMETILMGWMILKLLGVELMVNGSSWTTSFPPFLLPCSPFRRTLKLRGVAVTMNGVWSS